MGAGSRHLTPPGRRFVVGCSHCSRRVPGDDEAENANGTPFDEAWLETLVATQPADGPEALGRAILHAVERHAGDVRLADDLTALVLERDRPVAAEPAP